MIESLKLYLDIVLMVWLCTVFTVIMIATLIAPVAFIAWIFWRDDEATEEPERLG